MQHSVLDSWNSISLRTKITGVTVLVLTFGLLVSGFGTMLLFKPVLLNLFDQQVRAVASNPNSINSLLPKSGTSTSTPIAGTGGPASYFAALYDSNGRLTLRNWSQVPAGQRPAIPTTMSLQAGNACSNQPPQWIQSGDGTGSFRMVCTIVQLADKNGNAAVPPSYGTVIIAISTTALDNAMASYLSIFFGFGIIVVVIGAILTRMLVSTTFAPLREVERTAAAIADGDFSQRLGGATPNTEVGRLNRSLNTMLNRIDRAFKDRARTIDQMRRFVGDASHELRTPLVSVRGYAELYRMGALRTPEEVAQAMERIEKEAIRMGLLVEDLLELARLDETKPLDLSPVDLEPLANDAALDTTAGNPERTVRVVVSLPPLTVPEPGPSANPRSPDATAEVPEPARAAAGKRAQPAPVGAMNATGPIAFAGATLARLRARRPRRTDTLSLQTMPLALSDIPIAPMMRPVVLAEENKLRQVLNNLIGNAVRYTAPDSPLEIGVGIDLQRRTAHLDVIDHGEGIPPQIREKIFQRFWRADTSRTRETGGSGLGLAIVSSIVAAHNGTVDVFKTPGGGATFRVSLPLVDSPAAPQRLQ
ncbi:MAG TPA: HAMP domain-containing sensor histidine kinase [Humibacter sp.]|nr:HAMP domain-containing sensor histidine kinase [Humibacter sp.]